MQLAAGDQVSPNSCLWFCLSCLDMDLEDIGFFALSFPRGVWPRGLAVCS